MLVMHLPPLRVIEKCRVTFLEVSYHIVVALPRCSNEMQNFFMTSIPEVPGGRDPKLLLAQAPRTAAVTLSYGSSATTLQAQFGTDISQLHKYLEMEFRSSLEALSYFGLC
jgi:hypothetical protein